VGYNLGYNLYPHVEKVQFYHANKFKDVLLTPYCGFLLVDDVNWPLLSSTRDIATQMSRPWVLS
jgi:hypothetical protein